jgi:hypothetical protein
MILLSLRRTKYVVDMVVTNAVDHECTSISQSNKCARKAAAIVFTHKKPNSVSKSRCLLQLHIGPCRARLLPKPASENLPL